MLNKYVYIVTWQDGFSRVFQCDFLWFNLPLYWQKHIDIVSVHDHPKIELAQQIMKG